MSRQPHDQYFTPDEVADAIVRQFVQQHPTAEHFLEPSVGKGAFSRAIRKHYEDCQDLYIRGVDLELQPGTLGCDLTTQQNFLNMPPKPNLYDAVIGNPPFKDAIQHIDHALKFAPVVGFLLRLGILESHKRLDWARKNPPSEIWGLSHRPSFVGGGTDSCYYGFMIWDQNYSGPTIFRPGFDWKYGTLFG